MSVQTHNKWLEGRRHDTLSTIGKIHLVERQMAAEYVLTEVRVVLRRHYAARAHNTGMMKAC